MPSRLEIEAISRHFGPKCAVNHVSFNLQAGQVTCLLGPSGCGKSTILRLIAGLEHLDAGTIKLDGNIYAKDGIHTPAEQREIGLMFQDYALFPHLSVWENVAFGLREKPAVQREKAEELLERLELGGYGEMMPYQLSGGEQQRVALARAIAPRPKVMLLDEPFSGLDDRLRDGIRDNTLRVLREEGTAILMVTHDPEEAMKMADEIILLRDGAIVQTGSPYLVYNSPADCRAAAFFSDINIIRSTVFTALAQTPFGVFLTPGYPDGTDVEIVIRPQHLRIDFDRSGHGPAESETMGAAAHAKVLRARFLGKQSLVDFQLNSGERVTASVPSVFLPKGDTPFWLIAPRKHCYIFTCNGPQ